MSEYAALVAVDWADQQHAVCLLDPSTGEREQSIVKHTPAALQEWALSLHQRFAGQPIAVCLEQSRGPLIYALLQYDFFVLYPINLRQTFHEFAAQSIQDSFWARAYYSSQRAKGKDHHAAVRALAFKWIRVIWKCWQTRTPYNEVIYLESLRKKGSSLLKFAADYHK